MGCKEVRTYIAQRGWMGVVARLLVGAVLVFSSVVKGLDPYGTVLKMGEYCHAMGAEWATAAATPLAVTLIAAEMLVGTMLIFGAKPRLTARLALVLNGFFMLLTLWVAIANPVAECGCFGDVVRLTNWQTFVKNVVLVALTMVVWVWADEHKGCRYGVWMSVVATCGVVLLSIYSLLYLPVVDRFPFGVGVNISEQLAAANESDMEQTFVVCCNKTTGEERKFGVNDSEWWNEEVWEFVRTESPAEDSVEVGVRDFRLVVGNYDITEQALMAPNCRLLCVENLKTLSAEEIGKIRRIAFDCMSKGDRVLVVTASPLKVADGLFFGIEYCNMDATALRALLRAPAGVVTLQRGVVKQKLNLAVVE